MSDNNILHDRGILQQIAIIAAKGASGRLDIVAGATEGALLFKDGKLVDARVGHLTGFQAINAVASMPEARSHFDASVVQPTSSSITQNERVVLKQFFGIETVDSKSLVPTAPTGEVDEATVVTSSVTSVSNQSAPPQSEMPQSEPAVIAPFYQPRSKAPYITAFALAVLVIAVGVAAVLLRDQFRERQSAASVATTGESVSRLVPAETTAPAETTVPAKAKVKNDPATAAPDLTGTWKIVNTVHNTSYRSFQNLQIGFALSINQTGTTFTARGQKVSENGRSLPASSRTPIQVKGSIRGNTVEATFLEQGAARNTNGRFVWTMDRTGKGLSGTFSSTAARTSGKSAASREL